MGYIKHHAIVVTCSDAIRLVEAKESAEWLGLVVAGPSKRVINGYASILVCPDGSKEGWEDSDSGETRRWNFMQWLAGKRFEDGSSPFEWVEVQFGRDDRTASVANHEWTPLKDEATVPHE